MSGTILQFMNYKPIIYSGFDRLSISLAKQLRASGYRTVFIYLDGLESCPQLEQDVLAADAEIVILDSGSSPLTLFRQVYRLFRKHRPVLVHAHFFDVLKIIIALCALFFRVPLITTAHTEITPYYSLSERRREKGRVNNLLFRGYFMFLAYASEYCFCVSQRIRDQFRTFSWPSDKIRALYLGVGRPSPTSEKGKIRDMLNLSTNQILITNVSAIESSKGIDLIVEALAKLKSQYKLANFHFYHIGGLRSGALTDSFYEEQKQRIQDFGLTEHFTWIGIRTDVLDILPAFDIYIQPSRMEGLPVSVMEACSAGLPCIGSDISGIPEIIHNGENGYVIEQEDVDQLAFHLNELIEDETRRLEMGGHSKEIFAQNFDINTQVARTKQYYEELITR